MMRPSTHPAGQYRRNLKVLRDSLRDTIAMLPNLDSVDMHISAGDLIDELEDAISHLEHLLAHAPLPYR